jgi:HAD superfamily hydrolase
MLEKQSIKGTSEKEGGNMNKILTFDCYGTLLDTSNLYAYIQKIGDKKGGFGKKAVEIFHNYEDRLMYGEDFRSYDELLYEVLSYCDMEMNTNVYVASYDEILDIHRFFHPFSDVMDALKECKKQGYRLILMSNCTKEMLEWHQKSLDYLFDDAICAEDCHCYKPSLSFFSLTEDKFHLSDANHCHIAKGYWWDIIPAAKMGWKRIWVNRDHLSCGRTQEMPYYMIASMNELVDCLSQIL